MSAVTAKERIRMRLTGSLVMLFGAALLALIAWLPMTWQQQLVFGAVAAVASLVVNRFFRDRRATYVLLLVSICVTMRYAWWRVATLYHYLHSPWSRLQSLDVFFMILLLMAEMYSFTILILGYMQGISPLRRKPTPLPRNLDAWPSVDVFIPTYNEPLDLVRATALAASDIDWPQDRLRVVILDDGGRDEFRRFAEQAGIHYVARTEHNHAKAGNINHALHTSTAEYVAIFDSDHVPTRSFLQMTMGWFLRDPKLGMLQTPHHFYSPDPVERNLNHFRVVPNEGELFYGVIQDGNDLWNATFFCGSCAVLRREALDEVGGIAVETVTEDAHTSLRMQMKGWNTAYLNTVQAAGLATESISGHVRQRTRWARGMAQVLRIDNPLFAKGLKPAQRLCYLNAMLHFMYAMPRLIFLASPLVYLVFGWLNMPGYWLTILVFAAPHLILSTTTNARVQGSKRHTFWNEVYETILAPYILFPTWLALVNPHYGKFNVTVKGSQQEDHFDLRIGWPFLAMLGANFIGLAMAIPRYLYWNVEHRGTVLMNVMWTLFNVVILGVTVAVCYERRQRRVSVRVDSRVPVRIAIGAKVMEVMSANLSSTGMAAAIPEGLTRGQELSITFDEHPETAVRGLVTGVSGGLTGIQFADPGIEEQRVITAVLYLQADRWLNWNHGRRDDNILVSFGRVFADSLRGLGVALSLLFRRSPKTQTKQESALSASATRAAVLVAAVVFAAAQVLASPLNGTAHSRASKDSAQAEMDDVQEIHYPLAAGSRSQGILLSRKYPASTIHVELPSTLLMEKGALRLDYQFAPNSRPELVTLLVALNGNTLAALTPTAPELAAGHASATLPLPVDVFVQSSRLTFELTGAKQAECSVKSNAAVAPWVRIEPSSGITVNGHRLNIANDLSLLPEPFVQHGAAGQEQLSFVFANTPDWEMLRAAGVAASWFGMHAPDRAPGFAVQVGALPRGNAVLFLTGSQQVAGVTAGARPSVSVAPNPNFRFAKLLVFSAPNEQKMVELVQAFVSGQIALAGASAEESSFALPAQRRADDAPTWVQGKRVALSRVAGAGSLQASAKEAAVLYLRLAPDLDFDSRNDSYLSLRYTGGNDPLAAASNIAVSFNGQQANSQPMHASPAGNVQTVNIPLGDHPFEFRNTLTARLYPVLQGADPCTGVPSGFSGSISGDSYLDLGNAVHLARLPNLKMFSNAGFPYTRFADLSHTAVLLPEHPGPEAMALYLDLMGHFGAQTGYPALRVSVTGVTNAQSYKDKDLLLLGTYMDAALAGQLTRNLPVKPWSEGDSLSPWARWMLALKNFLHLSGTTSDVIESDAERAGGLIEASASPYGNGASVVAVLARTPEGLLPMSAEMLQVMPLDDIRGSASLWSADGFRSYELSGATYLVGDVPFYRQVESWMAFAPWLAALLLLAVCVLVGIWIDGWVQYRKRYRLEGLAPNQPLEVR